jgi:hypothetical protein
MNREAEKKDKEMDKEIELNGVVYVRKDMIETQEAKKLADKEFVICRTYSAGVFAGYIENRKGKEVSLLNSRRLWKWYGAASLSQLAMEGVKEPDNCKFGMLIPRMTVTECIEIIPCSETARLIIQGVKEWKV